MKQGNEGKVNKWLALSAIILYPVFYGKSLMDLARTRT